MFDISKLSQRKQYLSQIVLSLLSIFFSFSHFRLKGKYLTKWKSYFHTLHHKLKFHNLFNFMVAYCNVFALYLIVVRNFYNVDKINILMFCQRRKEPWNSQRGFLNISNCFHSHSHPSILHPNHIIIIQTMQIFFFHTKPMRQLINKTYINWLRLN
jgi:hypothetical protein